MPLQCYACHWQMEEKGPNRGLKRDCTDFNRLQICDKACITMVNFNNGMGCIALNFSCLCNAISILFVNDLYKKNLSASKVVHIYKGCAKETDHSSSEPLEKTCICDGIMCNLSNEGECSHVVSGASNTTAFCAVIILIVEMVILLVIQ